MKRVTGVFLAVMFAAGICAVSHAQAAEKFAYVDLSKLFSEYKKTEDFDTKLSEKEEAYTQDRDKQAEELKKTQDKLSLLSGAEQEKQSKEFEQAVRSFQDFRRKKEGELRKEQDTMMREILKDIEETVEKYAKQEGYTMVFNDRVLVYQEKTMDITDKILVLLNQKYK